MLKYNLVYQCENCNQVMRSDEETTKAFIDMEDIGLYKDFVRVGYGFRRRYKREYIHECYTKRTDSTKTFGVMKFVGVECSIKV